MTFNSNATIADNEVDFQAQLAALPQPNVVLLPRFSAKVKALRAGTAVRVIWAMVGDSLTAGVGADMRIGGNNQGAGYRQDTSLPAQTARALNAAGIPARADAFFGEGNGYAADGTFPQAAYYPNANVDFPGGWQVNGGNLSFGGHFFGNGNNQEKATFYPMFPANRFDFFMIMVPGGEPLTVEDTDGTVLATIPSDGNGMTRVTVSRPGNTISPIRFLRGAASGVVYFQGIAPWSTVSPRVEILNVGISGAQSQTFYDATGNEFTPGRTMQHLSDVDLFSIQLGQNEAGKTAAQFRTDMETLITFLKAKSNGVDIQLIKTHAANPNNPAFTVAADKIAALDAIATAQNFATPIDFYTGVMLGVRDYVDGVHGSEQGYIREAMTLARAIATRI